MEVEAGDLRVHIELRVHEDDVEYLRILVEEVLRDKRS